jgi:hypothetical protein
MPLEARIEIRTQHRQGHLAETAQQKLFGLVESLAERGIDGLFHQTAGHLRAVAHGQNVRLPQRLIDVTQRHLGEVAGDPPAAAMALFGLHEALIAQPGHDAADHHRVGAHGTPQHFRCFRRVVLGHMQQHMKDARQAAVSSHVTSYDA